MSRARIALPILLGMIVAIWGCTQPPGQTADHRNLESRVAKLEGDLKSTQDQLKLEQTKGREIERDREAIRFSLKAKGDELLKSQGELEAIRKSLKDMLSRVELALDPAKSSTSVSVLSIPVVK